MEKVKVVVVGGGRFGTALAVQLCRNEHEVILWMRDKSVCDHINSKKIHPKIFNKIRLPENLKATTSNEVVSSADKIVVAIPTQSLSKVLSQFSSNENQIWISTSKGLEISSQLFPTEIIRSTLNLKEHQVLQLSGPSFAEEIILKLPTAVALGASSETIGKEIQELFHSPSFRTYLICDIRGLEICGAMKNIIAVAAGASDGLGFKANSRAALVTRGLAEISRLVLEQHGDYRTCTGLGGLGDLLLTCSSDQSRNYQLGYRISQGEDVKIITNDMTAEGYYTSKAIKNFDTKVSLPISDQVYMILHEGKPIQTGLSDLLNREMKAEY